ncbi:phage prohead protease, HK97 family [Luteitalea pratensis]|uniref:Phage prohead protease, HK97 family n=1 Tax=Luteitalea pratensis TaxID=1855912 RepID=A0A143PQC9_LUTPR|nr:HK97 family phage prohead protease [Luteitalea pratensis]AMY10576.1 phage prohead protease, HK97 family [Luteitalea pratensis]
MTAAIDSSIREPLERRGLADGAQLTTTDTEGPARLVGYALRFGVSSEPLTGKNGATFVEQIDSHALDRLPQRRDVKALLAHDSSRVLGSTKAGTLKLAVDTVGLRFELTPPNSPAGVDLVESVRRRDLDGVSFGFKTLRDEWREGSPPLRLLTDVDLFEISFVAWPAYLAADVAIEARALMHAAQLVARQGRAQRRRALDALSARLAALR